MKQKINKLLPVICIAILLDASIHVLHVYTLNQPKQYFDNSWIPLLMILVFVTNYTFALIFAKRAGIFEKSPFLSRLLKCLLVFTPVIVLSPVITKFYWLIVYQNFVNIDWRTLLTGLIALLPALSILYLVKFVPAFIIALLFSIRLEAIAGISEKKELELYGTTTQGLLCRKWRQRHVWLVRAEYYVNGRRYETRSQIDRSNTLAENDSVTILYSVQNPYLSAIKEVALQK